MEQKRISRIIIPAQVRKGVCSAKQNFRDVSVIGIDTETVKGNLYSIQVRSNGERLFQIADDFMEEEIIDWIFARCKRGHTVFFSHNLLFELTAMFKRYMMRKTQNGIIGKYRVKLIYPFPVWMRISEPSKRKFIEFMDTASFFKGSLERVAEKYCQSVQKMKKPEFLGDRKPSSDEMEYFKEYAMTDADIAYLLGKKITGFHQEYNVSPVGTVSPATMAAKILRRHYISFIPFSHDNINRMALQSYWGGRTESLIFGTAKCNVYDFKSHYPHAAANIKIPIEKDKWKFVREFSGEDGFYKISGVMDEKKISPLPLKIRRLIFPNGKFNDVTVTGFEAKRIIECSKIEKIKGVVYYGKTDEFMKNFVDEFYKKKESSAKNSIDYLMNKIILNGAGYGKFMQLNPLDKKESFMILDKPNTDNPIRWVEGVQKFQASGMFNPVIASWITGFARARLYDVMNKYEEKVYYTDTDSVICAKNCRIPDGHKLGDLELEKTGRATVLREKLYVLRKNNEITKSATHGFWKKGEDLWMMINKNEETYTVRRMVKIKESIKQHKQALIFETQARSIHIAPSQKRMLPEGWKDIDLLKEFIDLPPIQVGLHAN